jgi:flagellar protein FliO/FliZ
MFNNLFGDGRVGGILAVVIGLCLFGLIIIYAWRAFGRGIRPAAPRGVRQPRLGIVDAFDLDRHRQLVLVRRDNVEHLIMIGGPNDLLIEEAIVRAQPSSSERREPMGVPAPGERQPPRMPIEPVAPAGQGAAPSLDVKPGLEPAATAAVTPPLLRPTLDPAQGEPPAPPPPLARPAPFGGAPGPRPMQPRPTPPVRPMPPMPPRPGAPTLAQRPVSAPAVTPPAPPAAAEDAEPAKDVKEQPAEQAKEPPKLTVNIDSLEEEMAKLLGRPVEPPKN